MRIFILALLAVAVIGCRGSSPSAPPLATPAPPTPASVATQISGASTLFDIRTLTTVFDVGGTGRGPLGLYNTMHVGTANARFKGFYVSEDLPQSMFLHLSMSLDGALPDILGDGGRGRFYASYEWWFTTTPDIEHPIIDPMRQPSLRIALRETDGGRGLFVDQGDGWRALPAEDSYAIGEYEISAVVHIDASWGIKQTESTFFRAVTRDDGFAPWAANLGDVFPPDLRWVPVLRY